MSTTPRPAHGLHVLTDGRAHLHWYSKASTDEIQSAGRAARAFLGRDRRVPSSIRPGFYPFRVSDDGNGQIGARAEDVEPA